jgi:hypothetical protein
MMVTQMISYNFQAQAFILLYEARFHKHLYSFQNPPCSSYHFLHSLICHTSDPIIRDTEFSTAKWRGGIGGAYHHSLRNIERYLSMR